MPRTMKPQTKATVVAICGPSHLSGWLALMNRMIWATVRDMTATGPMDTSLEVAKNCAWTVCVNHNGEKRKHGRGRKEVRSMPSTYAVDQDADEGGVEAILWW